MEISRRSFLLDLNQLILFPGGLESPR